VSAKDDERSVRPNTSKTTENAEKIRELIHEDHLHTIHELADTVGINYGVRQKILIENLNMRHIARKFVPRLLTNDQSSWLTTWLLFPTLLNRLAPCGFTLFPKIKMKLKGRYFQIVPDIRRDLQAVLDSISEKDF
jgi:hypothetical protein